MKRNTIAMIDFGLAVANVGLYAIAHNPLSMIASVVCVIAGIIILAI